ncbi:hypothetical protein WIW49_16880 [Xanthomonas euroxanthea]
MLGALACACAYGRFTRQGLDSQPLRAAIGAAPQADQHGQSAFYMLLQLAQTACLSSIGVAVASCRGHVIPTNCEVADEDLEEACRS